MCRQGSYTSKVCYFYTQIAAGAVSYRVLSAVFLYPFSDQISEGSVVYGEITSKKECDIKKHYEDDNNGGKQT